MTNFNNINTWGVVGCGWLGIPFASQLVQKGHTVIGTTTSKEKLELLKQKGIDPLLFSIQDSSHFQKQFNSCDYILINIPPSALKEKYADALIDFVSQLNEKTKIIFISSTSVYADNNQIAEENHKLDGEGRNASHIIDAEKSLQKLLNDRLTIIRMAGLIGKNRHPVKFMSGKSYNNGSAKVNLIHLDDCIGLINHVVFRDYFGEVLNGCSTGHPTKKIYYTWAAEKLNIPAPSYNEQSAKSKIISNKKSKNSLGFTYKYNSPYEFPI